MFEFCPHCGQTVEQEQIVGNMLVCQKCGKDIGFVGAVQRSGVTETEQRLPAGTAAACPNCQQIVELTTTGAAKRSCRITATRARSVRAAASRLVSLQPPPQPRARTWLRFMTRDVIKLVYCPKNAVLRIEVLTLEYLDKSDRVRIQVEALPR